MGTSHLGNSSRTDWEAYLEPYAEPYQVLLASLSKINLKLATLSQTLRRILSGPMLVTTFGTCIGKPVGNLTSRTLCSEPHQESKVVENLSGTSSGALSRTPIQNSRTLPYQQLKQETLSTTLSATLLGTLLKLREPSWESCWEPGGIQRKAAPACPETFTIPEDPKLFKLLGKNVFPTDHFLFTSSSVIKHRVSTCFRPKNAQNKVYLRQRIPHNRKEIPAFSPECCKPTPMVPMKTALLP